jgi:hypothetical protein
LGLAPRVLETSELAAGLGFGTAVPLKGRRAVGIMSMPSACSEAGRHGPTWRVESGWRCGPETVHNPVMVVAHGAAVICDLEQFWSPR